MEKSDHNTSQLMLTNIVSSVHIWLLGTREGEAIDNHYQLTEIPDNMEEQMKELII